MPKLHWGCYEKIGYPKVIEVGHVEGVECSFERLTLTLEASGQTREVRDVLELPECVAKVMPAEKSIYWVDGWVQNEVEHNFLRRLEKCIGVPRIWVYAKEVPFVNDYGHEDFLNLLIVSKLGYDMQTAAGTLEWNDYLAAYQGALKALRCMLQLGVVVPDPHPYNLAVVRELAGESPFALPCDYGSAERLSGEKQTHKMLKNFFNGFLIMAKGRYNPHVTLTKECIHAYTHCEDTIGDVSMKTMLCFFSNAMVMHTHCGRPPVYPVPPPSSPTPPPRSQAAPCEGGRPLDIGSFVRIKNLVHSTHLNGDEAFVQKLLPRDRVQIQTPSNHILSIASTNLDVIVQPPRVWKCAFCNVSAYWPSGHQDGWIKNARGRWRCPTCSLGSRPTSKARCSGSPPPPKSRRVTPDSPDNEKRAALGLKESSCLADIRREYLRWLLLNHPDKHPEQGDTNSEFTSLIDIWQSLLRTN